MPPTVHRLLREIPVLSFTFITALLGANDALDLVATEQELDRGAFFIALLIFAAVVLWRIIKLDERIDAFSFRVRLDARPGFISWNVPDPGQGKVGLETDVHFEIWTDVDLHTSAVILNLIALRQKTWWRIWRWPLKRRKVIYGLRPKGQDIPDYQRYFKVAEPQPFKDHFEFEHVWEFDKSYDGIALELVLLTGSPKDRFTCEVDAKLWERGSLTPA